MKYQILQPYCITAPDSVCLPAPDQAGSDDRLFIVSSDPALSQALVEALNQRLLRRRRITPEEFNDMLDETLTALGQRQRIPDLAFMLIQNGGILMAQMGRSRTLHLDTAEQEVAYDSRDQIMDFNAKARSELITRVKPGDCLLITLTDRVDPRALARLAGRGDDTDTFHQSITRALAANRTEAPASILLTIAGGQRTPLADMNWKWVLALLAALAAIVVVALLSLGKVPLPDFGGAEPAQVESAALDTVAGDTLAPPQPAVEVPNDPTPDDPVPTPQDETPVAKPVVRDNPEPVNNPEPAPQPAAVAPVEEPAPPATPTPQPTEPEPSGL